MDLGSGVRFPAMAFFYLSLFLFLVWLFRMALEDCETFEFFDFFIAHF